VLCPAEWELGHTEIIGAEKLHELLKSKLNREQGQQQPS